MMNYIQLKAMEKRLSGLISRSKKAYERNDNKAERLYAKKFEDELHTIVLDVKIDWPGLYPCFNYKGMDIYTLEGLLNEIYSIR